MIIFLFKIWSFLYGAMSIWSGSDGTESLKFEVSFLFIRSLLNYFLMFNLKGPRYFIRVMSIVYVYCHLRNA